MTSPVSGNNVLMYYYIDTEMKDLIKNTEILAETFLKIKDFALMRDFLQDVLTPAEINSLVERLQVLKLLLEGKSQRMVAKNLQCSISTVTRGSRIIQFGKQSIKKVIE